jgi:DNA-binding CsgD family transcriptional regulator
MGRKLNNISDDLAVIARCADHGRLSAREVQILQYLSLGCPENEISGYLGISIFTTRNHIANAKRKLQARNRLHAVCLALKAKLIEF